MNDMQRTVLFLGGGLAAGFAVATIIQSEDPGEAWASPAAAPLEARLVELERRLASEADARLALADDIEALRGELETLSIAAVNGSAADRIAREARAVLRGDDGRPAEDDVDEADEDDSRRTADSDEDFRRERRGPPTAEELEQRRLRRFVEEGFTPDRAAWIEQRTAELQMQQLEAEYAAARSDDPSAARDVPSVDEALRAELGDAEYERYLNATGRPTRVGIRNVLPSSPAEQVGLRRGDEIVSYAGKRVFEMNDLNELTLEGQPGEMVMVQVLRDGQPMQFYLPRGPIGVSGGGRGFRP